MIIASQQRISYQTDEVDVEIDDKKMKRVGHTKSLGITIDDEPSPGRNMLMK